MEAARTSETSVDNCFTRQYIPEDNSITFPQSFQTMHRLKTDDAKHQLVIQLHPCYWILLYWTIATIKIEESSKKQIFQTVRWLKADYGNYQHIG
jgi:hypothetical protein